MGKIQEYGRNIVIIGRRKNSGRRRWGRSRRSRRSRRRRKIVKQREQRKGKKKEE
jgi:hypothetical protein